MFTGIVEAIGVISNISVAGSNREFWIESSLTPELKIDQSVSHNGVCLTVVDVAGSQYRVTAVAETLFKTTLGDWIVGQSINLERSLRVGDRLDGHFVQGHVDSIAVCTQREQLEGSWLYRFGYDAAFAPLIVEKGSICVDGVSLTAFDLGLADFQVAIIPFTFEHTGFKLISPGTRVNIEFDVLGKYFLRSHLLGRSSR